MDSIKLNSVGVQIKLVLAPKVTYSYVVCIQIVKMYPIHSSFTVIN